MPFWRMFFCCLSNYCCILTKCSCCVLLLLLYVLLVLHPILLWSWAVSINEWNEQIRHTIHNTTCNIAHLYSKYNKQYNKYTWNNIKDQMGWEAYEHDFVTSQIVYKPILAEIITLTDVEPWSHKCSFTLRMYLTMK